MLLPEKTSQVANKALNNSFYKILMILLLNYYLKNILLGARELRNMKSRSFTFIYTSSTIMMT